MQILLVKNQDCIFESGISVEATDISKLVTSAKSRWSISGGFSVSKALSVDKIKYFELISAML